MCKYSFFVATRCGPLGQSLVFHQHKGSCRRVRCQMVELQNTKSRALSGVPTLPNFIVVGVAKCGTTNLCDLLSQHPEIFISTPKEPRFFSDIECFDDEDFRRNYSRLFLGAAGHTAIGEGTTTYTHPQRAKLAAERIRKMIPDCRLIYMVRHPIRRLESDWRMRCIEGWSDTDINQAVRSNPSLITHSLYSQNLQPYLDNFDRSQIKVVFLEDMSSSAESQLVDIYRFLGVSTDFRAADSGQRKNASRDLRKDGALARAMRRSGLVDRLRNVLPSSFFELGKAALTRGSDLRPHWDKDTLKSVKSVMQPDSANFLARHGKPVDYWRL